MVNKRYIELEGTEDEYKLLLIGLEALTMERIREGFPAECPEVVNLRAKIKLAWVEAEFHDENEAHNDWVNSEMYGKEVEPDPDVVVRFIGGKVVATRR